MRGRPDRTEVAEPYRVSFDQVPDGDVLDILSREADDTVRLLDGLEPSLGDHRYAPSKWSVKEVIGHLVDSERIMSYRALSFARGESAELPGYEQDDYVRTGRFDARSLASVTSEFRAVRNATLSLFEGFDDAMLRASGRASGCAFTVHGLLYVMCGHEIHHKRILRERYLE